MFEFDTKTVKTLVSGLAVAAGLAIAAMPSTALASKQIILDRATMDTTFRAYITYTAPNSSNVSYNGIEVYSNGVTFTASDAATPGVDYLLYGFCIDIFHDMYINTNLGYHYTSTFNPDTNVPDQALTTDYGGPGAIHTLSDPQIAKISALVDTGYLLNRDHGLEAGTSLQTAAIQAAIWEIQHPGSVNLKTAGLSAGVAAAYTNAFMSYVNINPTGPVDRIYTITDNATNPQHQTFAIGWPIEDAVPEPMTWALMLMGFGGMGAMLRRQRALATAA